MKTISPSLNTKRIRSIGEQNLPTAIAVCDRSVEEEDGEAGLHPSVHQTALDSSLWTKRERECVCMLYVSVCVSLIRASGLLCPLEIKDLKWNLKTERTLARPKSLERERRERKRGNVYKRKRERMHKHVRERKWGGKRPSQVLVESFTAFQRSIEQKDQRLPVE